MRRETLRPRPAPVKRERGAVEEPGRAERGALIKAACRFPGAVSLLAASAPEVAALADGQEAEVTIGRHALLVHREGPAIYIIGYAEVSERVAERAS